jgi:hypothetical protein
VVVVQELRRRHFQVKEVDQVVEENKIMVQVVQHHLVVQSVVVQVIIHQ